MSSEREIEKQGETNLPVNLQCTLLAEVGLSPQYYYSTVLQVVNKLSGDYMNRKQHLVCTC